MTIVCVPFLNLQLQKPSLKTDVGTFGTGEICILPGTIVLMDNTRLLHGRAPLKPVAKSTDRRCWAHLIRDAAGNVQTNSRLVLFPFYIV